MPHDHPNAWTHERHDRSRPRDGRSGGLAPIERRLAAIERRQHDDSRRVREILALLKQLMARDLEAVSFDMSAKPPTKKEADHA